MKLTRHQLKVLRVWLRYHGSGYGVGQWLKTCWKSWLLLGAVFACSFYFLFPGSVEASWGVFGLCFGAFLRDIGYYQSGRRAWPITNRVIDWKQVQELVDSHDKPVA